MQDQTAPIFSEHCHQKEQLNAHWTRLENLRMESNLSTIKLYPSNKEFNRPHTKLDSGWHSLIPNAIKTTAINLLIVHLHNHTLYTAKSFWKPPILQWNILKLPKKKTSYSQETLCKFANQINNKASEGQIAIFTDGSVNPDTGHSGAAVHWSTQTSAWRVSIYCSILQAELFAIDKALTFTLSTDHTETNIYTDFNKPPDDNLILIITLLLKIKSLQNPTQ